MKFLLSSLLLAVQSAYAIPFEGNQRLIEDPVDVSSNQCPAILVFRVFSIRRNSSTNLNNVEPGSHRPIACDLQP